MARKPQNQNRETNISPGSKSPIGSVENSLPRLFREATQLNTAATAVCVIGIEKLHAEIQKYAVKFACCRRPIVTVAADASWYAICMTAVARGGTARYSDFV